MDYTVDKVFDKVKFNEKALEHGEYENCIFRQCIFSNMILKLTVVFKLRIGLSL